eukprot:NODE_99_length_20465_cov_0.827654.p15 type:complete len:182 gc:universal NODE_99_length_20465_cov_0.827654:1291-746(-)
MILFIVMLIASPALTPQCPKVPMFSQVKQKLQVVEEAIAGYSKQLIWNTIDNIGIMSIVEKIKNIDRREQIEELKKWAIQVNLSQFPILSAVVVSLTMKIRLLKTYDLPLIASSIASAMLLLLVYYMSLQTLSYNVPLMGIMMSAGCVLLPLIVALLGVLLGAETVDARQDSLHEPQELSE